MKGSNAFTPPNLQRRNGIDAPAEMLLQAADRSFGERQTEQLFESDGRRAAHGNRCDQRIVVKFRDLNERRRPVDFEFVARGERADHGIATTAGAQDRSAQSQCV